MEVIKHDKKYICDSIAILMATYNGELFVAEQIESLLQQTYQNWELFIHDDGSNDNTVGIISRYAKSHPSKIHIIEGKGTGGAKHNFFFLMRCIDAPYVMFCDQDDVWMKEKIEKTYDKMLEVENAIGQDKPALVFSDLKVVNQDLITIAGRMSEFQKLNPQKTKFKDLLIQNVITGCTTMINGACLEKANVKTDLNNIIMHDWWCGLVAAYYGKIAFVDETLILYRQHEYNSVGAIPVSDLRYIVKKMWSGSEIKNALALTQRQAGEFAAAYGLEYDSLFARYSRLGTMSKLARLSFYRDNRICKSGFVRNLGLIVWG